MLGRGNNRDNFFTFILEIQAAVPGPIPVAKYLLEIPNLTHIRWHRV